MKSYSQFCPVAKAAELFCERWTPLILRDLHWGSTRFSELQRGVPLMSPTLLSQRLKQLEAEGVIERRKPPKGRGWTYHLTPAGEEFAPLVDALGVWGQRWSRRELEDREVDLGLLLWSLERRANPAVFGDRRVVIRLDFPDQPPARQRWWFVNESEQCEVCVDDPGFEVDLYLSATLPDMIRIVRGDIGLRRALDEGRLEALGEDRVRKRFPDWLNLSPLADVAPASQAA
ncbi:MAG: helix-turn-helix transcriptional regulator [Rhizobiaceae bacterium]|nr:helix-turn-helix transcriptional regulator [Rhizobiaceae bacterium]